MQTFVLDSHLTSKSQKIQEEPPESFVRTFVRGQVLALDAKGLLFERWLEYGHNALMQTAHLCYDRHLPFGLRPEVLWSTILSQVAQEVIENSDLYRGIFTTSPDQEVVEVFIPPGMENTVENWGQVLGVFRDKLEGRVPGEIMSKFLIEGMSTVGPTEQLCFVSQFMNAASPFYSYQVTTLCGIPEVAMMGTPEDWRLLRESAEDLLKEFESLADYAETILPILRKLEEAAGGERDIVFWKGLYKDQKYGSGGPQISGWLRKFYLYWGEKNYRSLQSGEGFIYSSEVPRSASQTPFTLDDKPCTLIAGVMGSEVESGYYTARLGWAAVKNSGRE